MGWHVVPLGCDMTPDDVIFMIHFGSLQYNHLIWFCLREKLKVISASLILFTIASSVT